MGEIHFALHMNNHLNLRTCSGNEQKWGKAGK